MTGKASMNAVIYCRVSDTKQKTHGDGLNSQESRCREYAKYRKHEVVQVFKDDASGGLIDRPGMKAMLVYLRKHRSTPHVVIIDDISRLARGLQTHLQLRAAIASCGASLESPSIEFGEDSDSVLVENLLASVSQHQRQKNGEQTRNRMRSRLQNGYWVFQAPVGYRYQRMPGHSKVLVRDEPIASIVQEALEGYASGRFQLQAEVQRFLESHPEFPRPRKGPVHCQMVTNILTRSIYAGYVGAEEWGVPLRRGHHAPLISYETYLNIQQRLTENTRAPARKNLSEDFALRGAVVCADCDVPLTASWSKGRSTHYPYYLCQQRGCVSYGKSIQRAKIEGEFETLLKSIRPHADVLRVARAMFEELWNRRLATAEARADGLRQELAKITSQVEQFLDRLADADVPSVISAYENRIRKLEEQKRVLAEKIAGGGRPVRSFDDSLRTAFDFLENPWKLWASERFEDKRAVLKLAFSDRLAYARNFGFRTVNLALPFKDLANFSMGNEAMVRPAGIEPATPAFGGQYSIH